VQALVTGGTGMVGHFIVAALLRRGHRVRAGTAVADLRLSARPDT
jgi:nucleoside-diphosphate-sugar epimerase